MSKLSKSKLSVETGKSNCDEVSEGESRIGALPSIADAARAMPEKMIEARMVFVRS
jgi:hypothetical protein